MLLHKIKTALTRLGFLGSCVLGGLKLAKNYKLAQDANRSVVYGAMVEITKNPRLWYHSSVGREYCHFTEEGREVIADLMQEILRTVDILEKKALDQRAKEIVFDTLKGKHETD
jgi:hypothetical protein